MEVECTALATHRRRDRNAGVLGETDASRPSAGEFRRRLEESKHKYLPWALYLTEDHLFAILATIGELAPLIHLIDAQLDRIRASSSSPESPMPAPERFSGFSPRWSTAPRLTFDDVHARIYLAIRKAQERTHRPGNWWTD